MFSTFNEISFIRLTFDSLNCIFVCVLENGIRDWDNPRGISTERCIFCAPIFSCHKFAILYLFQTSIIWRKETNWFSLEECYPSFFTEQSVFFHIKHLMWTIYLILNMIIIWNLFRYRKNCKILSFFSYSMLHIWLIYFQKWQLRKQFLVAYASNQIEMFLRLKKWGKIQLLGDWIWFVVPFKWIWLIDFDGYLPVFNDKLLHKIIQFPQFSKTNSINRFLQLI